VEVAPDGGAIAPAIGVRPGRDARDLLASLTAAHRDGLGFVQGFLAVWGRLPVLLAPPVLEGAMPLSPEDYAALLDLLGWHYNLVILDCGASVAHPLARFAGRAAAHLLLVGQPDPVATVRTLALVDYLLHNPEHRREATCLTVAVNAAPASAPPFFATPRWREVRPHLNAALCLPHSEPLRRRLDAGSLAVETVPTDVRRAVKGLLAPILGRLAYP
jgi:MinD-like ATPase involved in chromosome partitioning or flagellar assembly